MAKKRRLITRGRLRSLIVPLELLLLTLMVVSTQAAIHLPEYTSRDDTGFMIEIVRGRIEVEIVTMIVPMFILDQGGTSAWFELLDHAELSLGFSFSREQETLVGTTVTIRDWISIGIPLWFVMLLVAAPVVCVRRAKPWQCAACRYDLRGIEGGVCPECGEGADGRDGGDGRERGESAGVQDSTASP